MAETIRVWYSVGDDEDRQSFLTYPFKQPSELAEIAANHYSNLTAGEAEWPAEVILYKNELGSETSRHQVDMEWIENFFVVTADDSNEN